ncbi:sugar ABC transporter ATP-binding protein [Streptomyces spongiae]|uniref:Sugar ABC transporter ATP-binding protein n=1 Tax=Streptomyces spongiae TaxID=565072 RepID=A0A5N8XIY7_9ACTN|nr:sugar ABC transporter ATP-binding protein [Streptomyces spongiae]MPY59056.1 sugar ABC transporter ATP-binding protein [Streptomyces spongiae]
MTLGDPQTAARDENETLALQVTGLTKVYGGEVALADADLRVGRGEIHGLLGANGAGKSTLVKIVGGAEPQDAGTVRLGGVTLPPHHRPAAVAALGLAIIHQDRALSPGLTIAENIALVVGFPRRRRLIDRKALRELAQAALQRVGMRTDVDTLVSDLPIAEQTLVAIARALAQQADILILDEPTANLGAFDAQRLYERIRDLAAQGVACVLISHALDECLTVCDRVTVLRDGAVVASRPAAGLTGRELAALVVGQDVTTTERERREIPASAIPRLSVRDIGHERLVPLSFDIAPGEILGVTGLPDSGHLLVGEIVCGVAAMDGGEMTLDGSPYRPTERPLYRSDRVAYVPPDRVRDGLAVDLTARENLFLDGRTPVSNARLSRREEARQATAVLMESSVRPADPEAPLSTLSGGNMQKVLLAKWLATRPRLLVLAEPTVGVDIGAREDLYSRVRWARDNGMSILLTSSDLEETLALSDRILVMRYGEAIAEYDREELTLDQLTALTTGTREGHLP